MSDRGKLWSGIRSLILAGGFLGGATYWLIEQKFHFGRKGRGLWITAQDHGIIFHGYILFWIVFGIFLLRIGIREIRQWRKK